ncbi:EamA family transporter RarD [Embleya hyalina]|uniref:Protein RarD n=1 Tax=Embleya hyalina TaxID=516124 RepID=A0A401YZD6_9ACTN|nr:EamA family transporter RarD [Embleya hyalina]GCD99948.1 protein RarD [Embleya hyalina]
MGAERRGLLLGMAAYVMWGLFPLFWPHLKPAGPVEILAHRMAWSLLCMLVLLAVLRQWSWIRELARTPGKLITVTVAAVMISINWGTYIYGVNHDQVVETSLGYFITPLVLIGIGVVVLGERLRRIQWAAVALGVAAVVVLIVAYGRVPWIALTLAASFATYGYVKKRMNLPATHSLAVETAVMFLPALGYLTWLAWSGEGTFGHEGAPQALMLMGAGVITVIPLLFFAVAANSVPLSSIGMLQYLAPIIQFGIGVAVNHEPMPAARWAGFGLVWIALVILTFDAIRQSRRERVAVPPTARAAEAPVAVEPLDLPVSAAPEREAAS